MDTKQKDPKKSVPTRRRLLIGLAGTPIIASLPSRSAWGQCESLSGMLSGNLSDNHLHECPALGDGKTPDYYKFHPVSWPASPSVKLTFGKMYKANGPKLKEIEHPCKECNSMGCVPMNAMYSYSGGTTLDGLISQVLVNSGSSVVWGGGFPNEIMAYFYWSDTLAQQVAAALLNALHSGVNYPYSAREVAEAVAIVMAENDATRDSQLEGVLSYFNANYTENGNLVQQCSI